MKGLAPVMTLVKHELEQARSRLMEDQQAHEQKQSQYDEHFDRLQARRRTLKAEQSLYEDDFVRHRKNTEEFNRRVE